MGTRMVKRKQITCRCLAYPFPHRQGGGRCSIPDWCIVADETNWECVETCPLEDSRDCPRIEYEDETESIYPYDTLEEKYL